MKENELAEKSESEQEESLRSPSKEKRLVLKKTGDIPSDSASEIMKKSSSLTITSLSQPSSPSKTERTRGRLNKSLNLSFSTTESKSVDENSVEGEDNEVKAGTSTKKKKPNKQMAEKFEGETKLTKNDDEDVNEGNKGLFFHNTKVMHKLWRK